MSPLTALSLACVALSINQMLMARRIHQLEMRIRRVRRRPAEAAGPVT